MSFPLTYPLSVDIGYVSGMMSFPLTYLSHMAIPAFKKGV